MPIAQLVSSSWLIISRLGVQVSLGAQCFCGEIGKHPWLRIRCRDAYRFESCQKHRYIVLDISPDKNNFFEIMKRVIEILGAAYRKFSRSSSMTPTGMAPVRGWIPFTLFILIFKNYGLIAQLSRASGLHQKVIGSRPIQTTIFSGVITYTKQRKNSKFCWSWGGNKNPPYCKLTI